MNLLKTVPELAAFVNLPPSAVFSSVAGYKTDALSKDPNIDPSTFLQTDETCSVVLAEQVLNTEYIEMKTSQFVGVPLSDLFLLAQNPYMPQDKRTEMALVPGMTSYAICEGADGRRLIHRSNQKSLLLQQPIPKLSIHFRSNTYLPVYKKYDYLHVSHVNLNYLNFRSTPFNILPFLELQTFLHSILLFTDKFGYYVAFDEDFAQYYETCMQNTGIPYLSNPIRVPEMDDSTIVIDCSKVGRLVSLLYAKNFTIFKDDKWEVFCNTITYCHYVNGILDVLPEYSPENTKQKSQEIAARMQNLAAATSHMALIIEDGEEPLEMYALLQEAFGNQLRFKPDFYLSDSILGAEDLVSFLLPDMVFDIFRHEYLYLPELIGYEENGTTSIPPSPTASKGVTNDMLESNILRVRAAIPIDLDSCCDERAASFKTSRINSAHLAKITGRSTGVALNPNTTLSQDLTSGSILDKIRCSYANDTDMLVTKIRETLFGFPEGRWNILRKSTKQIWSVPNRSDTLFSLNLRAFATAAPILTKDYIRVLNWCPKQHSLELMPSVLASQPNARSSWLALRIRSFARYLLYVSPDIITFQHSDYAELLDSYLYDNDITKYVFIHTRVCPQWPFVLLEKTYLTTFSRSKLNSSTKGTQRCPFNGHYMTETSTIAFNSDKYELISYDNIYLSNVLSVPWLNEALPSTWKHFISDNTATICLLKNIIVPNTFVVVLSLACSHTSDPAIMLQVVYAEYYLYLFVQKQVTDRKLSLTKDNVLYVMAGQVCGHSLTPTFRMLTGGSRWTSVNNDFATMETSYAAVKQALKQYDELQNADPVVEEAMRTHSALSYESLFATIVCERNLLDLVCRSSNLVRVWSPVPYDKTKSASHPEASVMWDSDSYTFYLAAAEEDCKASAKLTVFGVL